RRRRWEAHVLRHPRPELRRSDGVFEVPARGRRQPVPARHLPRRHAHPALRPWGGSMTRLLLLIACVGGLVAVPAVAHATWVGDHCVHDHNPGHVALIQTNYGPSADNDYINEAKCDACGTDVFVETYRFNDAYVAVRREGWVPDCYPQCQWKNTHPVVVTVP